MHTIYYFIVKVYHNYKKNQTNVRKKLYNKQMFVYNVIEHLFFIVINNMMSSLGGHMQYLISNSIKYIHRASGPYKTYNSIKTMLNINKLLIIILILSCIIISMSMFAFDIISNSKSEISTEENYTIHFVKSGDTLWNLATIINIHKYNGTRDVRDIIIDIQNINNLSSSKIVVGQSIYLPMY